MLTDKSRRDILYTLATVYQQANNIESAKKAIELFEQVLEIDDQYVDAYLNKGIAYCTVGEYQNSIACFEKVISLDPNNSSGLKDKAIKNIKVIKSTLIDPNPTESIEYFDEVLRCEPNNIAANLNKATAYSKLGKAKKAIEYLDIVISIDPNNLEALFNKASILCQSESLNDIQESLKYFDKVLKLKPDHLGAYMNKGIGHMRLKETTEAIECFKKVISKDPENLDAWYRIGILSLQSDNMSDVGEAIKCFDKILQLNPNYNDAILAKGLAYSKLGEIEKAIKCFDYIVSEIDSAINSVEQNLLISDKSEEEKQKISIVVQEIKDVVTHKKQDMGNNAKLLNQVISKQAVQEDIIKSLVEHAQMNKQTLDLHMNIIMQLRQELGLIAEDMTFYQNSKVDQNVSAENIQVSNIADKENEPLIPESSSNDCCNCTILPVYEIKYDNSLLNNPQLLNASLSCFGLSSILEFSQKISSDLMTQIINNNDSELLLGALMSVVGDS